MAYNPNVIFPETWSQGSSYGIGFDTNILSLENGTEYKIPRMAAWGRRKYNIARNVGTRAEIMNLVRFYQLRGGSRDSFKFKDWMEYASTSTGYVDETNFVTPFDVSLQLITGTTYQIVLTTSDAGGSVVRPIEKIKVGTLRCGINGTEVFSPTSYTYDGETGQVTFSTSLGAIASATAGFEFYTVVSFAPETDQNLEALMGAVQTNSALPAVHLIEDVSRTRVTQYGFAGGSYIGTVPNGVTRAITMLNGKFQVWSFGNSSSHISLPDISLVPTGGPIFVIYAATVVGSNAIKTSDGSTLVIVTTGKAYEIYALVNGAGVRTWYVWG
jgi:uncharacterized protein (TIGR02217 family)